MKAYTIPPTPTTPTYVMELSEPEMLSLRQLLRNLTWRTESPLFAVLNNIEDDMQAAGWPKGPAPKPDYTFFIPSECGIPERLP